MSATVLARMGAITYFIWGLLHIVAAYKVYALALTLEPGMVQGSIFQDAWSLLCFAVFAMVISLWMNWRNSRLGYWLNLIVTSTGDIGYIAFVLLPGFVPMVPGALGPVLWIAALILSTLAAFFVQTSEKAESWHGL